MEVVECTCPPVQQVEVINPGEPLLDHLRNAGAAAVLTIALSWAIPKIGNAATNWWIEHRRAKKENQ